MSRTTTLTESVVIAAPPEEVYAAISDLTQMGKWSPENAGATPADGATGPARAGSAYWGHNRRNALMQWTTYVVVTAAEPGRRFAFASQGMRVGPKMLAMPIASWEYRLEPVSGGTRVLLTWSDDRGSTAAGRASRLVARLVIGGRSFAELTRRNMQTTLQRLKQDLEAHRQAQLG